MKSGCFRRSTQNLRQCFSNTFTKCVEDSATQKTTETLSDKKKTHRTVPHRTPPHHRIISSHNFSSQRDQVKNQYSATHRCETAYVFGLPKPYHVTIIRPCAADSLSLYHSLEPAQGKIGGGESLLSTWSTFLGIYGYYSIQSQET